MPQALEVIKGLQEKFPIERAQMTLRVLLPGKDSKAVKPHVLEHVAVLEGEDWQGETLELVGLQAFNNNNS